MFERLGWSLIAASRLGLILAIVIASAAYGLTRESTVAFFNQWLAWIIGAWVLGSIVSRKKPRTPTAAWVIAILILCVGWTSAGLGWLDVWLIESFDDYPTWWDSITLYGATHSDLATSTMLRTSALIGATLVAIDLFSNERWTRALFVTWAATAVGMVIFFFLQKSFGEPFLIKSLVDPRAFLTFATFRYWGNAASYLNLCWPLLVGLAAHSIAGHRARGWTIWLSCGLLVFAAVFLNVSKAGNALGLVGLFLFVSALGLKLFHRREQIRFSGKTAALVAIPLLVILVSLVAALPTQRWEYFLDSDLTSDGRLHAYGFFLKMLPDAGVIGFGPGNFQLAYWNYVGDDPAMARTPFWVAHQDYLQTVIEWGYLGTFAWGLFFALPTFALVRQSFFAAPTRLDQRDEYAFSWSVHLRLWWEAIPTASASFLALGGLVAVTLTALHALVDFPMQIASLQFYFLLWMALGWHLWHSPTPKNDQRTRQAR